MLRFPLKLETTTNVLPLLLINIKSLSVYGMYYVHCDDNVYGDEQWL